MAYFRASYGEFGFIFVPTSGHTDHQFQRYSFLDNFSMKQPDSFVRPSHVNGENGRKQTYPKRHVTSFEEQYDVDVADYGDIASLSV